MPTVVRTIGSAGGRDYSTLAAWAASLPANLVTDGNSYRGDCYNDSEFTGSATLLTLSGHTTDASHTITLTTGPGQSFRDNANVQTTALNYNPANGVGINSSVTYAGVISISDTNVFLSRLQVKSTGTHASAIIAEGPTAVTYDDCIMVTTGGNFCLRTTGGQQVRNSLLLLTRSGSGAVLSGSLGAGSGCASCYFCTVVAPSDVGTPPSDAISSSYGSSATMENCAFFGCTGVKTGSTPINFTTYMTDVAGPPSGVTGGKIYANQFQNTTTTSGDFREKSGADLRGAGTADSISGAFDIAGSARPQGGHWDIGCWELLGSGTIVAADARVPIELVPIQRIDQPLRVEFIAAQRAAFGVIEIIATQRADPRTRLELVDILRSDRGLSVEDGSGVGIDTAGHVESLARAVTEWLATAEWPTRLFGNMAATGELTATLACGAPMSPEWTEAIATLLSADTLLPVDWSVLPASVLVSLDRLLASPGKRRHLATPGRLRLLKRL